MATPGSYTYFRKREFYQFVYYSEFEVELVMTEDFVFTQRKTFFYLVGRKMNSCMSFFIFRF
jgi:hypothetical protein